MVFGTAGTVECIAIMYFDNEHFDLAAALVKSQSKVFEVLNILLLRNDVSIGSVLLPLHLKLPENSMLTYHL